MQVWFLRSEVFTSVKMIWLLSNLHSKHFCATSAKNLGCLFTVILLLLWVNLAVYSYLFCCKTDKQILFMKYIFLSLLLLLRVLRRPASIYAESLEQN